MGIALFGTAVAATGATSGAAAVGAALLAEASGAAVLAGSLQIVCGLNGRLGESYCGGSEAIGTASDPVQIAVLIAHGSSLTASVTSGFVGVFIYMATGELADGLTAINGLADMAWALEINNEESDDGPTISGPTTTIIVDGGQAPPVDYDWTDSSDYGTITFADDPYGAGSIYNP